MFSTKNGQKDDKYSQERPKITNVEVDPSQTKDTLLSLLSYAIEST